MRREICHLHAVQRKPTVLILIEQTKAAIGNCRVGRSKKTIICTHTHTHTHLYYLCSFMSS